LSIALGEAGVGIAALVPRTATLEELFFRMTEGEAAQAPAPAPTAAEDAVVEVRA
jgi:ABC-2 type transport system ATP-binding protein